MYLFFFKETSVSVPDIYYGFLYNMRMGKTIRIIVISDNHGFEEPVERIREIYRHRADYFFHLGDSEMPRYLLEGYACVRGNNDYYGDMPNDLVLSIGKKKVLLTHGHRDLYWRDPLPLARRAASLGCCAAFFGHTHIYTDITAEGIRLLNPGSIWRNRDGSAPSYMIAEMRDDGISAVRMEYQRLK